ncbi:LD-carboxypeptidase [Bacillus mangrovi]|uniref:LD-carboxypeptidase n=1 Tax=Metabacillus mangrovi TaxID=1491830 RepID=A0A7X2V589_9BACI|nr:S66 peptidase family protein [Metabacillus mangrovi]MTH53803.1 LD-carboxypeptidase [Metabacillus mangrovi]
MIQYPNLQINPVIGVTAPSSGVPEELHMLVHQAAARLKEKGMIPIVGDTVWTQEKAKSAPAKVRAAEWNQMMADDSIHLIFPPWGGELLIEMLPYVDFDAMKPKWILGYSDCSAMLLAVTLKTGIATSHGTNLIDIRGEYSDGTTARWLDVLSAKKGDDIVQTSSDHYQKKWQHDNPSPCVFHLTEKTEWKTVSGGPETFSGRLLGGCIDVIHHLIGTEYGDLSSFRERTNNEQVVWFLENCEMNTTSLKRSLVQMKLAGWFHNCSGIMFGRSAANDPVEGYTAEDVYREIADELQIPVVYDIDCGHVPPQITFVNGAFAEVEAGSGKGTVRQTFK